MPVSYVPEFVAKTESISNPLPRSFLVSSLSNFAAWLDNELLLCPVRALRIYLDRTFSFSPVPRCLFLSPRRPAHALSKNAIAFFLREVIHGAGAARPEVGSVRAHGVRGISTSAAFHKNWSIASVLESATWCSNSVFASFYLRDFQHEFDGLRSLGPFVAAGERIGELSPLSTLKGWGGGGDLLVLLFCIPHGPVSTSDLCSGPALHNPVGEVLPSFIVFVLFVFILSIVLSFILGLSLQGTSFYGDYD